MDVGEPIVPAQFVLFVGPGRLVFGAEWTLDAMASQFDRMLANLHGVGEDRPPFAATDVLDWVKAQGRGVRPFPRGAFGFITI